MLAESAISLEVELEGSADRGVQESESVLAGLNVEIWPRLSIHMDNISVKTDELIGGVE